MTFIANELSNYGGRPVLLYTFVRNTATWRYTTADQDHAFDGVSYTAVPISDQGVRQSGDAAQDELMIRLPAALPVVQMFRSIPPSERVGVTVRRLHWQDSEAPIMWTGQVNRVKRVADSMAEVYCQSLAATLQRGGLRLTWQRNCPHMLYDTSCGVNRADYAVTATVAEKDGQSIAATAWSGTPEPHFIGGFIQWTTTDGFVERRGIRGQSGGILILLGGTDGIAVGTSVTAYPGCGRSRSICNDKFGNITNFGGFDLPGVSPFNGDPVF